MPPAFTQDEIAAPAAADAGRAAVPPGERDLLICLPSLPAEQHTTALKTIAEAFGNAGVAVATPHPEEHEAPSASASFHLLAYTAERANLGWVLAASDYAAAARLASDSKASTVLLLADVPVNGDAATLRTLAQSVASGIDLVLPRFHLGPNDGLVNFALLYPLTRALLGADVRFPLPATAAMSSRMVQRLGGASQRMVAVNQGGSLLWPVSEAAVAGFTVREVDADGSTPPAPPEEDFNVLFANVASSLFADIESRAAFWQRARTLSHAAAVNAPAPMEAAAVSGDVQSIIENFHLAQANLQEIWSMVLPPQSRLAFKKLAQQPADAFQLDPGLWARTVYDFALAFHLRTLNRNHLLGAMTPLYLAWVASHLRTVADDAERSRQANEQTAAAFETEKPYFVSRWRWPDRFNP